MRDMADNRPIGVFDSGVGGLTVFREIMNKMPDEKVVYFGDTARVPYGDRDPMQVVDFSRQIVRFLRTRDVKAVVIACNTATAPSLPYLRAENDIPVIGVIRPGAKGAVTASRSGKIGIIATAGTIKSGQYPKEIHEMSPEAEVFGKACPKFVPLIEAGKLHGPETGEVVHEYIEELKENGIDALVMGCTHYPLLYDLLHEECGDGITLVNPAEETVKELREVLAERGELAEPSADGRLPEHEYYCSDDPASFKAFAAKVLPQEVSEVGVIDIEKY